MRYDNAVAGGLDEIGTLPQEEIIMENIEASCTIVSVAIRRTTPASPAALRRLGSFVLILVVLIAAVAVVPASSSPRTSVRGLIAPG
jgi:hypothetical protein